MARRQHRVADRHAEERPDEEQAEHHPGGEAHRHAHPQICCRQRGPPARQSRQRGADDHGDHEDGEAGIDEVHPDVQQHRRAPGEVIGCSRGRRAAPRGRPAPRQAVRKIASQRRGRGGNQLVEHVEGDLLALRHQHARGPEDDPDVGDGSRARSSRRPARRRRSGETTWMMKATNRMAKASAATPSAKCRQATAVAPSPDQAPAALMRSSMPVGQFLAKSELRKASSTWVRKAATSGVVTVLPCASKKALPSASVAATPSSLSFLAAASAARIALLLVGAQPVPEGLGEGEEDVGHLMAGQHDLLRDLVELGGDGVGQRVLQPVDGAGLHREVDFLEGQRRGVGAERVAEELPGLRARHAQLQPLHVGRRLHRRAAGAGSRGGCRDTGCAGSAGRGPSRPWPCTPCRCRRRRPRRGARGRGSGSRW